MHTNTSLCNSNAVFVTVQGIHSGRCELITESISLGQLYFQMSQQITDLSWKRWMMLLVSSLCHRKRGQDLSWSTKLVYIPYQNNQPSLATCILVSYSILVSSAFYIMCCTICRSLLQFEFLLLSLILICKTLGFHF